MKGIIAGAVRSVILAVYEQFQKHCITFRLLIWLREQGIIRKLAHFVGYLEGKMDDGGQQEEDMRLSREFYAANEERAKKMLSLLADEKSKTVWGGGNPLADRRRPNGAGAVL